MKLTKEEQMLLNGILRTYEPYDDSDYERDLIVLKSLQKKLVK